MESAWVAGDVSKHRRRAQDLHGECNERPSEHSVTVVEGKACM